MKAQAVAIIHRDEILEAVSQGAMLKSIAAKLGVTPGAISQLLHDDADYRKAREIGAEVRLEEQFVAITGASDHESISRAREGFRAAAWFAEREFPHRWGAKQEVTLVSIDLAATLREARQRAKVNEISDDPIAGSCVIVQDTDVTP